MPMSGQHNNVLTNMTAIYVEIIKSARPIPYSNSEKGVLLITILLRKTANRDTPLNSLVLLFSSDMVFEVFLPSETPFIKNKTKKRNIQFISCESKG